jgi:hypothetical protein
LEDDFQEKTHHMTQPSKGNESPARQNGNRSAITGQTGIESIDDMFSLSFGVYHRLRACDTREEGRGREQVGDWRRSQSELLAKDSRGAHFPSP